LREIAKPRRRLWKTTVKTRVAEIESGSYRRGWSVSHRAVTVFAAGLRSPVNDRPSDQGAFTNNSASRVRLGGANARINTADFLRYRRFCCDRAGSTSGHDLPALMLLIIGWDTPNHLAKKPH
jgi:hypothetical protein